MRGVGAVGGPRHLRQLARQIRVGELVALLNLIALLLSFFARLPEAPAEHRILAESRLRERVEVVAVADPDDGLAAIGDALDLREHVVGGRERDVRAVADFATVRRRSPAPWMMSDGFSPLPVIFLIASSRILRS